MTVAGIGIDIVDIARFKKAAEDNGVRFLEKIFTPAEIKDARRRHKTKFTHMAGKFAAKEAVKKALPDGVRVGLSWPDIEIINAGDGKPHVRLHGEAKKIMEELNLTEVLVSISHTRRTAVSNAVVIKHGA